MKTVEAIVEVLKREGVEYLFAYPVNHIIEYAARADIRPIIVRQERVGSPTEAPRHTKHSRSSSALGSVKGK